MQARFAIACDATSCPSATWFPLRSGNRAGHLRYRKLLVRQNVQLRNNVSQMLMESGVVYNKQKLHKVGYFKELMETNQDVGRALRPLLTMCRETIVRIGNGEIFYSVKELRVLAERWRVHYNTVRPHSSLGYRSPAPEAWLTNNMGCGEVGSAYRFPLLHTPDGGYLNSEVAALH
jgi:hypothetical protein